MTWRRRLRFTERGIATFFDHAAGNPIRVALMFVLAAEIVGGTTYSLIEGGATWFDGLWWAFVTMATIGYGDYAPKTPEVRMVAGYVLISGLIATWLLSAALLGRVAVHRMHEDYEDTPELDDDLNHVLVYVTDLVPEIERIKKAAGHPLVREALRRAASESTEGRST